MVPVNCAGGWGSTACNNSDGNDNGQCKDKARVVRPPIGGGVTVSGTLASP